MKKLIIEFYEKKCANLKNKLNQTAKEENMEFSYKPSILALESMSLCLIKKIFSL